MINQFGIYDKYTKIVIEQQPQTRNDRRPLLQRTTMEQLFFFYSFDTMCSLCGVTISFTPFTLLHPKKYHAYTYYLGLAAPNTRNGFLSMTTTILVGDVRNEHI